jgi:cysteine synthase B
MIARHITELIGNTPLFLIDPKIHGLKNMDLYAKLEFFNPFGSVKDRLAWGVLKDDITSIKDGQKTVIEMSSGNTAKALTVLASVYGSQTKTITNRIKVPECKDILRLLGTEIQELPGKSDCHDPNDPNDPLVYIERELQARGDALFFTSQYKNPKNVAMHYATTGEEILRDLPRVDYFFGGVGTSGSTRGTAQRLSERDIHLKTIGIVAAQNDYIPGIRNRDEILEVGLFDPSFYEQIVEVSSDRSIEGMCTLMKKAGLLAGPTTGACYEGMLDVLRPLDAELTERKTAVFIACDRMEWYISYVRERRPDLFGQEKKMGGGVGSITPEQMADAPTLTVAEADTWIQKNDPIILDIRGHMSFHAIRIRNSFNIPEAYLRDVVEGCLPFPPTKKILVVCPVGQRSRLYAAYLTKKGYDTRSLATGLYGWRDAGNPVEEDLAIPSEEVLDK